MAEIILSIIIPVYNVESCVARCIESCFPFLKDNVELIVVDDGSTDSSGFICDNYSSDKIRVFHKKNGGLSDARNFGVKHAAGNYLWFVDSDDMIYPINEALFKGFDLSPDIISMNYIISENETEHQVSHTFGKSYDVNSGEDYLKKSLEAHSYFVPVWSYVYRKDYFISNNFEFRKGLYHEDEQLTPYLLLKAKTVMLLNEFGYKYIIRTNSIATSKNNTKNVNDLFSIYLENEKFFLDNIEDKYLRELLLNDIVEKVIYVCSRYNVSNQKIRDLYDISKISRYCKGIKNKIKAFVFIYFRNIYALMFKIYEKEKSK